MQGTEMDEIQEGYRYVQAKGCGRSRSGPVVSGQCGGQLEEASNRTSKLKE